MITQTTAQDGKYNKYVIDKPALFRYIQNIKAKGNKHAHNFNVFRNYHQNV